MAGSRGLKTYDSEIEVFKRFIKNLGDPHFRGLVLFGNRNSQNEWRIKFGVFLEKAGGKYNVTNTVWEFPWGAQLKLQTMADEHDAQKIRGFEFTDVEMDQWAELKQEFKNLVMSRSRNPWQ